MAASGAHLPHVRRCFEKVVQMPEENPNLIELLGERGYRSMVESRRAEWKSQSQSRIRAWRALFHIRACRSEFQRLYDTPRPAKGEQRAWTVYRSYHQSGHLHQEWLLVPFMVPTRMQSSDLFGAPASASLERRGGREARAAV